MKTSQGDLTIYFVGHASLFFEYGGNIIHVDPFGRQADYRLLPKADAVVITHEHQDHFDLAALDAILKPNAVIVSNAKTAELLKNHKVKVLKNGDSTKLFREVSLKATPAYNTLHKREDGVNFHPKGEGNGYILTFGNKRVYIAGDTEPFAAMDQIKNIDIAFMPMNLPFTMTPEMVKEAALIIKPKILYPYHYGSTDTNELLELMRDVKDIEVRIRKM
jgi:L-ascorbate metabolism protein UlaG (beta-lactamase superfamily)